MKKSLLAVAALGAFASAAQAQSSVTVYGIMDAGYVGANERVSTGAAVLRGTQSGFGDSAESTSRIGFKGTEDLGGGLSAFFTVEIGLNLDTQFVINTSVTQNRQSFVGLNKNGLGNFAFGTQYTTIHNAVAQTDPAGQNNIMGDLIYTGNKIATGGNPSSSSSLGTNQVTNSGNGSGDSYTIRQNNMLTVNTENFGGFVGHAFMTMRNQNSNQTQVTYGNNGYSGGIDNSNGWGLGADYTWNKLFVTGNYQAFNAKNPWDNSVTTTYAPKNTSTTPATSNTATTSAASTGAAAIFGASQGSTPGINVKDNQWYVAATYDFGILKAYAQYLSRKATSQIDPNAYISRTAEQIGVRSYITPTIEGWASAGMGKFNGYGATAPTANIVGWQVGSNYWLSKRTNLYAIYGQQGTSNVAIGAVNPVSYNANNYALGLRHTF
jgi:predicted porin